MTNEEIIASLEDIKERQIRKKTYAVRSDGKKSKFTLEELGDKPLYGEGHVNYYKGKKIDREKFGLAVDTFFAGSSIHKTYKLSGLSEPTYVKRMNQLIRDGFIPAELMSDGKQFVLSLGDTQMGEFLDNWRGTRENGT